MMRPLLISLGVCCVALVSAFLLLSFPGYSAPAGTLHTYLPITQSHREYNLPDGNLLLYVAADSTGNTDLYLSPPPPGADTTFRLSYHNEASLDSNAAFSPDGTRVVFSSNPSSEYRTLEVVDADGAPRFTVATAQPGLHIQQRGWSADGSLLAHTVRETGGNTTLYVTDIATRLTRPVAEDVRGPVYWDRLQPRLFYVGSNGDSSPNLTRVNADGSGKTVLVPSAEAIILWDVSADGYPIVRLLNGSDDNLWRVEPESGTLSRLTNDPDFESAVSASPVGDRVFFSKGRGPQYSEGLYIVNREGTVLWQYAFDCGTELCRPYYTAWSPGAAELSFSWWQVSGGVTTYALYTVATDGSQSVPTQIVPDGAREMGYSPDGRYLAYHSMGIQVLDRVTGVTTPMPVTPGTAYFFGWRPEPTRTQ